jgi:acyl-CoA dehydrogenase
MRTVARALSAEHGLSGLSAAFSAAVDALEQAIGYVVENYATDIRAVSVGAVPMLKLFGIVAGGWQLLRSALIAQRRLAAAKPSSADAGSADAGFYEAKILTARFYADYVLSQSSGLAHGIVRGAAGALAEGAL